MNNREYKDAIVRTLGELANTRSEDDDVWTLLYNCVDIARALDQARHAAARADWVVVDTCTDEVDSALQAIIADLAIWQVGRVSRETSSEVQS